MPSTRRVELCPHCSSRGPQTLLCSTIFREVAYRDSGKSQDEVHDILGAHYILKCETCGRVLVYAGANTKEEYLSLEEAQLVWPESSELHHSVPDGVAYIYEEASKVMFAAPSAFVVQIRRALEAVCDDRGIHKGVLAGRLKELSTRGEIPPVLVEAADLIRLFGNIGAHSSSQSVRWWDVAPIDQLFRAVVEYVYIAPYRVRELRRHLDIVREAQV